MDFAKMRFNLAEIYMATGIDAKTLTARKNALVKAGELETVKGRRPEFTYDEVKKLLRKPYKPGEPRGEYVTALRRQLQNDGYQIKKGGE